MNKNSKIYIAGHGGLVGGAILRNLQSQGYENIITRTSKELDLKNQLETTQFFEENKPEFVFLAAAKVGGIIANNMYRGEFIYDNILIQSNVIHNAYKNSVKKLLFLGSSCIYPKMAPQPMPENALLTGELEYTNEPYAIAKIAGIKMCESYNLQYGTNFISAMPTNLYGPGDNFDLDKSHVLPAIVRKVYLASLMREKKYDIIRQDLAVSTDVEARQILDEHGVCAKKITLWGSGRPLREFLWSEDLAKACIFLMNSVNFSDLSKNMKEVRNTHINIGSGIDLSIRELAHLVKEIIGYTGDILFDETKPDGTPRKLTDVTKIHNLGWRHKVELPEGIEKLYNLYRGDI
ncbi:MAG: GDP-L-fucose synthase [Leptospirales bacterium]